MSTPAAGPTPTVFDVARLFIRHPLRWLLPAAIVAAGASAYALLKPATWEASQALMVRAEAGNNPGGPGRFRDLSEMKTFQETVLEVAKNKSVLTAALQSVGPPEDAEALLQHRPAAAALAQADLLHMARRTPARRLRPGPAGG